jgi:hypothetical protein
MKTYADGGITPRSAILDLGTRWQWVIRVFPEKEATDSTGVWVDLSVGFDAKK